MTYYIAQNQSGSLPLTFSFELPITGNVTIAFSGTCWSSLPAAICGVAVLLDGKHLGDVPLYFNNAKEHLTLPTFFFPADLGPGPHTILLRRITDTTYSDENDYFSLWIVG